MTEEFDKLQATYEKAKESFFNHVNQYGQAEFEDRLKAVLDKYPMVSGVSWTQSTPSFNDGDPCTFDVGGFDWSIDLSDFGNLEKLVYPTEVVVNEYGNSRPQIVKGSVPSWKSHSEPLSFCDLQYFGFDPKASWCHQLRSDKVTPEFVNELIKALNRCSDFDDDVFLAVFGDDQEISYDRENGLTTEEYCDY